MRAQELEGLAGWIVAKHADCATSAELKKSIDQHITAARDAADGKDSRRFSAHVIPKLRRSGVERTLGNLDAVETDLLRLAPDDYLHGQMPGLLAHVQRFLPKDDPRRIRVVRIAERLESSSAHVEPYERDAVVGAYHAASSQRRRELIRLRSFRNVILVTAFLLVLAAAGLGLLGAGRPDAIPLCFKPDPNHQVCPTGADPARIDMWLIEVVGLVAAVVAAAFALRSIRGTSTPYSLPVALALLKLPRRSAHRRPWPAAHAG